MTSKNRQSAAAALAGHNGFSLISGQKLRQLYSALVHAHLLEERAQNLFPQSRPAGNSEAAWSWQVAMVAATADLLPEDSIAPLRFDSVRDGLLDFLLDFLQGKPLKKILAQASASTPPSNPAALLHRAIGAALMSKTRKNGGIVVAFRGAEDDSSGAWEEALHVACLHRLPILFVGRSEHRMDSVLSSRQIRSASSVRGAASGSLPRIPVDGNDLVAVYRVATEALAHARKGSGATLIECESGRCGTGPGKTRDPILNMEAYLTGKGLFSAQWGLKVAADFTKKLDAALETTNQVAHQAALKAALKSRVR